MEDDKPETSLEQKLGQHLQNRYLASRLRKLTTSPPGAVDFSSNDFLSLSTSPMLRSEFLAELDRHSDSLAIGSRGSRLLDGNSVYADRLEEEIAAFHAAPAGLLWNSGFDANSGFFACVPQVGDVIVHDELIHASVHDGMKLSRAARRIPFAHNSVEHLRQVLEGLLVEDLGLRRGSKSVFIAVESVYSMDGDLAPLVEIVRLKKELFPRKTCYIIVDEAHATGVIGRKGRGLVSHLELEKEVFARLHTFGKGLGCSGAIILCTPTVRSYLINYARPLIYTTFMPFPALAAIKGSYSLLQSGRTEALAVHLRELVVHLHSLLQATLSTYRHHADLKQIIDVPSTCPESPIFSLQTHHARNLANCCQDRGFVVRAVVPPTVPTRRVRVCLHAGNSKAEVEALVRAIDQWVGAKMLETRVSPAISEEAELVKARL
jgi:8-amino-7-oxononanoate synthase